MRRAARTDANHAAIVEAFRAYGWSVQSLAAIGKGCPDLVVGRRGRNLLVEVKTAKGTLSRDERAWLAAWCGQATIVRSVEDVAALHRLWLVKSGVYSAATPAHEGSAACEPPLS